MKKLVITISVSALLFSNLFCQNQEKKKTDEKIIIGDYSYWVNSMCSQNCDYISIGNFRVPEKIQEFRMNEKVCIKAVGEFVTMKELPTIAGPNPKVENPDDSIEVERFKISEYEKFDFPKVKLTKSNKKLFENKEAYKITFSFENPFDFDLEIKYNFNYTKLKKLIIPAKTKKEITETSLIFEEWETFEIYVRNTFFKLKDDTYYTKVKKENIIIDVNKSVKISDLL